MTTSERRPVFSLLSFSICAIALLARLARFVGRDAGFHAPLYARGHIFDRYQNVEFEIPALDFFRVGFRVKAVLQIIVLLAGRFLQRVRADVMIRDHEPSRGDERTAAAGVETDARFLQMLEPLRRRLELILFLELFEGRIVEQPHPFIGRGGNCSD